MINDKTKQLILELSKELDVNPFSLHLIGSTLICGKGNDIDILFYNAENLNLNLYGFVPDLGNEKELEDYGKDGLRSYRRGIVNLIEVQEIDVYLTELTFAVSAALQHRFTTYNFTNRESRVKYHRTLREVIAEIKTGLMLNPS